MVGVVVCIDVVAICIDVVVVCIDVVAVCIDVVVVCMLYIYRCVIEKRYGSVVLLIFARPNGVVVAVCV